MSDLFASVGGDAPQIEQLGAGVTLLHSFALPESDTLLKEIDVISQRAPYRHLTTPGGFVMSVETTSCGTRGWFSDQYGYRYVTKDPVSDVFWPEMPQSFLSLAERAAAAAGFNHFVPDACLINRYAPGTKMSLHQDKNERDFSAPIVSVSLGLPATFMFGGNKRNDPVSHLDLLHGDVLVWGRSARLRFHGVMPVAPGNHPACGPYRLNLTFRLAG